jgi:hypothetical protein
MSTDRSDSDCVWAKTFRRRAIERAFPSPWPSPLAGTMHLKPQINADERRSESSSLHLSNPDFPHHLVWQLDGTETRASAAVICVNLRLSAVELNCFGLVGEIYDQVA